MDKTTSNNKDLSLQLALHLFFISYSLLFGILAWPFIDSMDHRLASLAVIMLDSSAIFVLSIFAFFEAFFVSVLRLVQRRTIYL